MSTEEERKGLKAEPLPICDEDRVIPTKIARINAAIKQQEEYIKACEQTVEKLTLDKNELLKRAAEIGIVEDKEYTEIDRYSIAIVPR